MSYICRRVLLSVPSGTTVLLVVLTLSSVTDNDMRVLEIDKVTPHCFVHSPTQLGLDIKSVDTNHIVATGFLYA